MKINRKNYELYFMDYLDGNLTDRDIRMLEDFLLENPDLRTELEGTEKIVLFPQQIVFYQKDFLLKPDLTIPVNKNNFEDFCIASAEGDLTEQQNSAFINYISENPGSEKEFLFYTKLHLTPDISIIYPGKENLKKTSILVSRQILYPILSVAAAVAFLLILYVRNENISKQLSNIVSEIPTSAIVNPASDSMHEIVEKSTVQHAGAEIQEASVLSFANSKSKKKSSSFKTKEYPEKKIFENKNKEHLQPQRLNPSFQIKLPSLTDNHPYAGTIEKSKITFDVIKPANKREEYLTLSEYARKQLAKKVLGDKNPLNSRISAWDIADAGIAGINKLTGGEMKLDKKTGNDGNVTAYSFNSKLLSFSTTAVK
jgi:hypothetical protein